MRSLPSAQNSPSPDLMLILYLLSLKEKRNRNRGAFVGCCVVGSFVILMDEKMVRELCYRYVAADIFLE